MCCLAKLEYWFFWIWVENVKHSLHRQGLHLLVFAWKLNRIDMYVLRIQSCLVGTWRWMWNTITLYIHEINGNLKWLVWKCWFLMLVLFSTYILSCWLFFNFVNYHNLGAPVLEMIEGEFEVYFVFSEANDCICST